MLFEKLIRKLTIGPFCSVSGGANHSTRIVEAFSAETLERFAAAGTVGIINIFKSKYLFIFNLFGKQSYQKSSYFRLLFLINQYLLYLLQQFSLNS